MKMKHIVSWLVIGFISVFALAACSQEGSSDSSNKDQENTADDNGKNDDKLEVASSFSILSDIVDEVGGDQVDVYNIVPVGNDPHDWDPSPDDTKKMADADIFFYNGLNLEGGDSGWVHKLVESTEKEDDQVFKATQGVEPKYLGKEEGNKGVINPHAFTDPNVGMKMAKNIRDAFIKVDPDHKDAYEKNAEDYLNKLHDMDQEYTDKIKDIPKDDRVFMASERAYQYMTDQYGLKEGFIWEIDTEDNGTPSQIKNAVQFVKDNKPPVLFIESNVSEKPMKTVSNETGVEISDIINSDELGKKGTDTDTYLGYLKSNIEKIHKGLTQ